MEEWKDVVGYEGLYQVSNFGRVKRLAYYNTVSNGGKQYRKEKILTPIKIKMVIISMVYIKMELGNIYLPTALLQRHLCLTPINYHL